MKSRIIVGTRGSKLALTQTNQVIEKLKRFHPSLEVDVTIIKTTGDIILDKELSKIGGKGLFIKEIEEALEKKEVDFAVHSMKDVPHTLPEGFEIGAILVRANPKDVLITRNHCGINDLAVGSIVGTSSLRRILQLKNIRSDLKFQPMRGNIDTRINKLANGEYDGIVLAAAGLKRLGWNQENNKEFFQNILKNNVELHVEYLETDIFIPAVGQGALAIEIRENDKEILDIIKVLHHNNDAICVETERAFLKEIDGGCEIPIGAYATLDNDKIKITGFIGDEEKSNIYKHELTGSIKQHKELGIQLAKELKEIKKQSFLG